METFNLLPVSAQQEITDLIIEHLQNYNGEEPINDFYELHHEVFNTDYFIVGYYPAEQWISKNIGIFKAIDIIVEYENDMFGEVYTDLTSSEKVVNMFVYIVGEELISSLAMDLTVNEIIEHLETI